MTHAIPTVYGGIEYRSRLEARWAAMFDQIGWKFTYEPFDGAGYIPDFLIHGDEPLLVEIKPAVTEADYHAPIPKVTAGLKGHWDHDILILGADPMPSSLDNWSCDDERPPAGLLGEWRRARLEATFDGARVGDVVMGHLLDLAAHPATDALWEAVRPRLGSVEVDAPSWIFETGLWFRCDKCSAICVYHSEQSYSGRPCGCYDGTHYLGHIDPDDIKWWWSQACNAVKWNGRNVS